MQRSNSLCLAPEQAYMQHFVHRFEVNSGFRMSCFDVFKAAMDHESIIDLSNHANDMSCMRLPFLRKLRRWLEGSFVCIRCHREFHIASFGFGKAICPDCYKGESQFLFFDHSYWLNVIVDPSPHHKRAVRTCADRILSQPQIDLQQVEVHISPQ